MREEEEFVPDYSGCENEEGLCIYFSHSHSGHRCCNYCVLTGKLRGCPPGKDCKRRETDGTAILRDIDALDQRDEEEDGYDL